MPGCPIRISADHIVCANPRSFSQLITSFFASKSLGILHTPLLTFFYYIFLLVFLLLHYVKGRFTDFVNLKHTSLAQPSDDLD